VRSCLCFANVLEGNRRGAGLFLGRHDPDLNRPDVRFAWKARTVQRPRASVVATPVRKPLVNVPPGPLSGR